MSDTSVALHVSIGDYAKIMQLTTLGAKELPVDTREAGRRGAKKRWANKSVADKKAATEPAHQGARAYWASMTKEERSAEMKRRAAKRKKKAAPK